MYIPYLGIYAWYTRLTVVYIQYMVRTSVLSLTAVYMLMHGSNVSAETCSHAHPTIRVYRWFGTSVASPLRKSVLRVTGVYIHILCSVGIYA